MTGKPSFREVVLKLLQISDPYEGASTANQKAAGCCSRQSPLAQRADSSSSCLSNGVISMASPFKIPKKKQLGDPDSVHLDMQSPLSRLQSPTPQLKSYGLQSSRTNTGNALVSTTSRQSMPGKPSFREVVQKLLKIGEPNAGASTANHKAAGGRSRQSPSAQRAEPSSSRLSNGWRPKRASDRLLQPDKTEKPVSPPRKKKSLSPSSKTVSVKSPDSLAELRGEQHARNSSTPGGRTRRREESSRDVAKKSNAENSPETSTQRRKNSGSERTPGGEFVFPSMSWKKPSADKSLLRDAHRHVASSSAPDKRPNPDRCDDPRERERQKWKEFRENRSARRSAVLVPRLKKPKPTPTEPIVLSSEDEEEGEDEGDGGDRTVQSSSSSSRLEESRPGNSEQIQARRAYSSRGQTDGNETTPPPPPPSFLQLQFASLHAGLAHIKANGEIIVTETDITIPLKGSRIGGDVRLEGAVTVVASQVRGYGVWDGGVAQEGTLLAGWKGPPPSLLFLWVSDAQANLLQRELSSIQTSAAAGPPCSYLLLVLKEQLQELQVALLASILDMKEYRKVYSSSSGPPSPVELTDGLLLFHSCPSPLDQHLLGLLGCSSVRNRTTNHSLSGLQQLPTRLIQYPPPPCKGRITVTKEDLACLDAGQFLNDVIIDFYLKFLLLEGVGGPVADRSHVFSSFFYKQLSRRRAAGESDCSSVPDRHTRHQRVKTWTRHVDIFTKDFLFVPVNQEAHWFLVVVCFPGLEEVQYEAFQSPTGGSERAAGKPSISLRSPQPPECTHQGWHRNTVLKRPCILVLDSLKLSYHEIVCRLLRDYLQVEWEVRRGTPRLFTADSMRSSNCRVAQQDNSSDCGVFLLQYAESFLQNPVVHFDLPLRLEHWFPQQRVRQKRKEIRSLIMTMHGRQSGRT